MNKSNTLNDTVNIHIENLLKEVYNIIILTQNDMIIDYHISSPEMINKDSVFIGIIQKYFPGTESFAIKINDQKGFLPISSCVKQFPNLNLSNGAEYENLYVLVQQVSGGKLNKNVKYTGNIVLQNPWFCIFPFIKLPKGLDVSHKIMSTARRTNLKKNFNTNYSFTYKTIVRSIWNDIPEDEIWHPDRISDLEKLWIEIKQRAEEFIKEGKEGVVYEPDNSIPIAIDYIYRYARDSNINNFNIIVRNRTTYNEVKHILKQHKGIPICGKGKEEQIKIILRPKLTNTPINKMIDILQRKFITPDGVGISIDQTEAGTLIDINSVKFQRDPNSNLSLNCQINLLAIKYVFKLIKLRSISGIIILDLINPEDNKIHETGIIIDEIFKHAMMDNHKIHIGKLDNLFILPMTRSRKKTDLFNILISQKEDLYDLKSSPRVEWQVFTKMYSILHNKVNLLEIECSDKVYKLLTTSALYIKTLNYISKIISYKILDNVDLNYINIKTIEKLPEKIK